MCDAGREGCGFAMETGSQQASLQRTGTVAHADSDAGAGWVTPAHGRKRSGQNYYVYLPVIFEDVEYCDESRWEAELREVHADSPGAQHTGDGHVRGDVGLLSAGPFAAALDAGCDPKCDLSFHDEKLSRETDLILEALQVDVLGRMLM